MSVKSSPKKTREKKNKGNQSPHWATQPWRCTALCWANAGATKPVFNSPNRPGLWRGWAWGSPMLTHALNIQNRGRYWGAGCPGLSRCSWLHGTGPEVAQRCHSLARRGAFCSLLQRKENANTTCQHMQCCWLSASKTKDACLLSCICSSRSFSIKQ